MTISELKSMLDEQLKAHGDLDIRMFEQRWGIPYGLFVKVISHNDFLNALEIELEGRMEREVFGGRK